MVNVISSDAVTSASMLVFLANVLTFLAYDLSICLATLGLRCLPSTADMSFHKHY